MSSLPLVNKEAGAYNGEGGGAMDRRLDAVVDRLDRLTAIAARSSTGHFQRAYVAVDIANPAPLGLFAFALATGLYMTSQAEWTEGAAKFIAFPLGIFFGGLTMLFVAMWELVRRNVLGATAFGTYGSFWISVGVYGIIKTAGIFFLDSPKGEQALTALFGIASIGFMAVSIAINLALPLLFLNLGVMFFLLSGGVKNHTCAIVAGYWGVITSGLAFYIGLAGLFEDLWGFEVLPVFYTKAYKKHAKLLFPRISDTDPMGVTGGAPGGPGTHWELHHGDNVAAMYSPSLESLPRPNQPGAASSNVQAERVRDMTV